MAADADNVAESGWRREPVAVELVAIIKHDCPVCVELLPVLDAAAAGGAPLRIVSQSSAGETAELRRSLGLVAPVELDDGLVLSARYDPDAVPTVLLLDAGEERGRVEGLARDRLRTLASEAGVPLALDGLPAHRPGCASRTRDPRIAATLAVRAARAEGRLRSRSLRLGAHEDPFEALHERGLTDGLPVVPPTPERVVALLEGTSRHPQDVVGIVPPYGGTATVEKVAVNAVMAGCRPEHLPFVLAAVEAACEERFSMHGLLATTHPAGPLVVASGPLTARAGMNARGNCLGQGNRANLAIGRSLQLVVRNLGGGRPQLEDRSAHGQPGKVGACFAELLEGSPWEPLSADRGFGAGETTVTLYAAEAPRLIADQVARDPAGLCASFGLALQSVAHPKSPFAWDALLVVGPEHGRILREAGWDRARVRGELMRRTTHRVADMLRGAGGSPEGLDPAIFGDNPEGTVPKFAGPERIGLVHAGGSAGLFSMVYGMWASGDMGSTPVTRRVEPWM
jgi:hypothetical protein